MFCVIINGNSFWLFASPTSATRKKHFPLLVTSPFALQDYYYYYYYFYLYDDDDDHYHYNICFRMDVIWNPDEYSVEDLVVILGQKVAVSTSISSYVWLSRKLISSITFRSSAASLITKK